MKHTILPALSLHHIQPFRSAYHTLEHNDNENKPWRRKLETLIPLTSIFLIVALSLINNPHLSSYGINHVIFMIIAISNGRYKSTWTAILSLSVRFLYQTKIGPVSAYRLEKWSPGEMRHKGGEDSFIGRLRRLVWFTPLTGHCQVRDSPCTSSHTIYWPQHIYGQGRGTDNLY